MRRRFVTLDVFTQKRFAGNPLAVVLAADALEGAAMQAIAREFNLAETVFVLPPAAAAHRARLRIFTPATELPFAGHPTVGSAVLLNRIDDGSGARTIILEEGIGTVRCVVEAIDAQRRGTSCWRGSPKSCGSSPWHSNSLSPMSTSRRWPARRCDSGSRNSPGNHRSN